MNKVILGSLVVMIVFLGGLFAAEGVAVSTTTTEQPYDLKLIIDGKWGTKPGEFGTVYLRGATGASYDPSRIATNSQGDIYILDEVNSRIQKFDRDGKYLLSIPIVSMADEADNSVVKEIISEENPTHLELMSDPVLIGVDMLIDAKDDMYYYLVNIKAKTGEIWLFRKDALVKKWDVPMGGWAIQGQGMMYENRDDSIWIYDILEKGKRVNGNNKSYEVKSGKTYSDNELKEYRNKLISKPQKEWTVKFEFTDDGTQVYKKIYK